MVTITLDAVNVSLGGRDVVKQASTIIEPGQMIGIIGPNGAGKSTLIRAMLGLVPVSGGTILLDDQTLERFSRREVAARLAYLPQGQTLHWPLTVERLVALGRLPHLAPLSRVSASDVAIVEQAMMRADVLHLRRRSAIELSGGERARVMLARALAVGAPGLVVDEPLASLDPGHQIDVMELLAREAKDGALVVAVLHDLTMAARYCDRLLLIDDGRLVADGAPVDVLTAERLAEVYCIRALVQGAGPAPMIIPLERTGKKDSAV